MIQLIQGGRTIAAKYSIYLAVGAVVAIMLSATVNYLMVKSRLMEMEQRTLHNIVDEDKEALAANVAYGFDRTVREIGERLSTKNSVSMVIVEILGKPDRFVFGGTSPDKVYGARSEFLINEVTLQDPTTQTEVGTLTIAYSLEPLKSKLNAYILVICGVTLILIFLIVVLSMSLRRALLPLKEMADKLDDFSPMVPSAIRFGPGAEGEVKRIQDSVEKMTDAVTRYNEEVADMVERLNRNEGRLKEAQEIARVGGWEYEYGSATIHVSDSFYEIFGFKKGRTFSPKDLIRLVDRDDRMYFIKKIDAAIHLVETFDFYHAGLTADKKRLSLRTAGRVIQKGDHRVIVGVTMDMTEHVQALRVNDDLAYFDGVTGVFTPRMFASVLEEDIASARESGVLLAVMKVVIAAPKMIGAKHDANMDDHHIRHFAEALAAALRKKDRVCRAAKDTFILAIDDIGSHETLASVADKIMRRISRPYEIYGQKMKATGWAGLSVYYGDEDELASAKDLIKKAEAACTQSIKTGPGVFRFYSAEMESKQKQHEMLEQRMKAIIREPGQLKHYVRDAAQWGKEVRVGALMPEGQAAYPVDVFRDLDIDGCAALVAGAQIDAIKKAAKINRGNYLWMEFFGKQIQDRTLPKKIRTVLDQAGFDASSFCAGVSEVALEENIINAYRFFREVSALGMKAIIVDYGHRAYDHAHLDSLQIDKVRFSKSVVRELLRRQDGATTLKRQADELLSKGITPYVILDDPSLEEAARMIGVNFMVEGQFQEI